MDRRKALKTSAAILGYALSASTTAAVLNGCKADPSPDWEPRFLDNTSAMTIDRIVEIIIPTTDTPGAKEAMVGRFIDGMLSDYATEKEQELFKSFMTGLQEKCEKGHGKPYLKLDTEQQSEMIRNMLKEEHIGMKRLYELTVAGYCTSEVGGKELLVYDPIPGPFKGCIPLDEVGGIYSLN